MHGLIPPSRIVGSMLLVLAAITFSVDGWRYAASAKFLREARSVPGTVAVLRPTDGENGTTFLTVFTFVDHTAQPRQGISGWSSNPPGYAVGDRVDVLYTAADASNACIHAFSSLWLLPAVIGGAALFPLIVGIGFVSFLPFTIRRVWPRPE